MCNFSNLPVTIVRPHNFMGQEWDFHIYTELIKKFCLEKVKIISYNHKRTFYFIDDAIEDMFN